MSMVKIIPPDSQTFNEQAVKLIKVGNHGLRGNDLAEFIKRAGHEFANRVQNVQLKEGDVPVHIIALGDLEHFGCNRNADSFPVKACRAYHDTFQKHARCYRNHVNTNPANSFGFVKYSMYNEPMGRIELLAILNGTEKAAQRNGGKLATEELEKLHKEGSYPTSMSCRVPKDRCSGCGNEARNRSEYCTDKKAGGTCKYGGLKHNMGVVFEDGQQLHAINDEPDFFDISKVFRNADRISFALGKCASAGIVGGAQLAEELGISTPAHILETSDEYTSAISKLAHKLADLEDGIESSYLDLSFNLNGNTSWCDHGTTSDEAIKAMALCKVAMPVSGFAEFVANEYNQTLAAKSLQASQYLPKIFNHLIKRADLHELIRTNMWRPSYATPSMRVRCWAEKLASDYSIANKQMTKRAQKASLYCAAAPLRKQAKCADESVASNLAIQYALYELALLHEMEKSSEDVSHLCEMIIRMNQI